MLDLYTNIIYSKAQLLNNSTKTHKFQEKQPFFFLLISITKPNNIFYNLLSLGEYLFQNKNPSKENFI